jgi:hypothetical protein
MGRKRRCDTILFIYFLLSELMLSDYDVNVHPRVFYGGEKKERIKDDD